MWRRARGLGCGPEKRPGRTQPAAGSGTASLGGGHHRALLTKRVGQIGFNLQAWLMGSVEKDSEAVSKFSVDCPLSLPRT